MRRPRNERIVSYAKMELEALRCVNAREGKVLFHFV